MTIIVQCPECLKTRNEELPYSYTDYQLKIRRWKEGGLIQDVFPELDSSQREALITGICDDCWDTMFLEKEPPF